LVKNLGFLFPTLCFLGVYMSWSGRRGDAGRVPDMPARDCEL